MKRRYTILFFLALSPLIGLSWMASTHGGSVWATPTIALYGQILAALSAGAAMIRNVDVRWPAGIAAVALLPTALSMLRIVDQIGTFTKDLGWSLPVIVFGALATFATAAVIAVAPKPRPPADPQVAPARVVD